MASQSQPYPSLDRSPDLPAIEQRSLAKWAERGEFRESVEQRPLEDEFVFYDGPPFANGLPHHGHLLTGYVKDVVPRYRTMRGQRVERRFGWDCHGLPVEMESEKELGVSGRAAITDYGIAEFNAHCRTSVMRYTKEWEVTVGRQARWVDFVNDYKTMDLPYMESVIWAFKQLWDKGLVYEAYRVMPYSWGAETPLSNFEIRLDDATRPRQDPALTVAFDLVAEPGDPGPMKMLAWTTTPWTLPSNLALAVGPDIDYAVVELDGTFSIIGDAARVKYEAQLEGGTVHTVVKGRDLVGRRFMPLFDYFADRDDAFRVLGAEFVDTSEGTGIVHMAPGFGEDDQIICEANEIPIGRAVPVDDQGRFTDDVPEWAGENVFDANPSIIRHLKELGRVVRHDTYEHNYPHCWRTDTPIIYKAISSWFVEVTAIRDRMVELNRQINWVPEHVRDGRFGMWLAGARDWSISRNRFWGAPIPVWRSDDPTYPRMDVYGSLDELERDFGVRPTDLHRPSIDDLVRPNPDDPTGKSMMRRVPEVLDCWFESGSMPYAQVHYPFENKEWFEDHFPADFIVEYINQTRGWFYTLHVLATALFDRPAFANVICHGIVLDAKGHKLSKKLRNYTEPDEIFATRGADALRFYLMASPIVRGGDLRLDDTGIDDVIRQIILPLWNACSFFTLYANIDGYQARVRTDSTDRLDRYILAKAGALADSVTERMDTYDLPGACAELGGFIDALNNWYIRRSRDRFWQEGDAAEGTKADAYDTLYTVLTTFLRAAAPLLPLVTEELYGALADGASVHLTSWPDAAELPHDPALVSAMDRIRDVCSVALRLREDAGLRVRLPLPKLTIAGHDTDQLRPLVDLIAEEVNVKSVALSDDLAAHARFVLRPNGKTLGPKLGKDVQAVFGAARAGEWQSVVGDDGAVTGVAAAGHVLAPEDYDLALESPEGVTAAALRTNDAVVVLDTTVTPELEAEGLTRDVVRQVQQARKEEDLVLSDRIELWLELGASDRTAVEANCDWLAEQVLARSVHFGAAPAGLTVRSLDVDGRSGTVALRVI